LSVIPGDTTEVRRWSTYEQKESRRGGGSKETDGCPLTSVNKFAERIAQGLEEAKAALTKAKDEYAMYYNQHQEPAPVFTQGDRVWLDGSNIATNRPSSKLSHRCLGLFVTDKCVGQSAYRLILPPHFCHLHPVFPVVKLSLAHPDPVLG
jgi:hypothetical protein